MRELHLGRRVEALPMWLFGLLLAAVAVTVVAGFLALADHTAADGTRCGSALVPVLEETPQQQAAGCGTVLGDARPLTAGAAALAVVLVVAVAVTLIARGWRRREVPPWPGG